MVIASAPVPASAYLRNMPTSDPPAIFSHDALLDAAIGAGAAASLRAAFLAALDRHSPVAEVRPDLFDGVLTPADAIGPEVEGVPLVAEPPTDPDRAVVLAILDETVPHSHPRYLGRFASIWVQDASPSGLTTLLPFGREISGFAASELRGQSRAARLRGTFSLYDFSAPQARGRLRSQRRFTHGAAVLSQLVRGTDANFPLIAVSFPSEAVRDTSGTLLPYFVLLGLLHVLASTRRLSRSLAGVGRTPPRLPIVINLSYGVLAGPKDGSGPLDRVLDALADPATDIPGIGPVHVVVPMGNGRQSRSFACVSAPGPHTIGFRMLPEDRTPTFVEIRAPAGAGLSVSLHAPRSGAIPVGGDGGDGTGPVAIDGVNAYYETEGGGRLALILAFSPTVPAVPGGPYVTPGNWALEVSLGSGEATLAIQRDDSLDGLRSGGRQARFVHPGYRSHEPNGRVLEIDPGDQDCPITRSGTINTFASGPHMWSVGGQLEQRPAAIQGANRLRSVLYSGLARAGGTKPEEGDVLAASDRSLVRPGLIVGSMLGGSPLRVSGTSVAVPQVARRIARFMSEKAPSLTGAAWPDRAKILQVLQEDEVPRSQPRLRAF